VVDVCIGRVVAVVVVVVSRGRCCHVVVVVASMAYVGKVVIAEIDIVERVLDFLPFGGIADGGIGWV